MLAAAAAPAIIRTPGLLMPVKPTVSIPTLNFEPIWKITVDIDGMLQELGQTVFYGDAARYPTEFKGFALLGSEA